MTVNDLEKENKELKKLVSEIYLITGDKSLQKAVDLTTNVNVKSELKLWRMKVAGLLKYSCYNNR